MLYMRADGTLVIDSRPLPDAVYLHEERERRRRMAENERRYRAMKQQAERIMAGK